MSEWFEKIVDDFCEEQAVEDRTSVETLKDKFYTDLTEQFLCSLPTLLFKFLIEKGVGHIVEPRPSLHEQTLTGWKIKRSGKNLLQKGRVGILPEQVDRTIWAF